MNHPKISIASDLLAMGMPPREVAELLQKLDAEIAMLEALLNASEKGDSDEPRPGKN